MKYQLYRGDCLDIMPTLEAGSVDAIITDPPYPYIKRDYGYWTEAEWLPMMQEVVRQSRRILKDTGSMVIILQPNSEKVGKMRLWLWRFMLWCGEYWNIVQDAYWWNSSSPPTTHCNRFNKLMRPSVKYSLWLGEKDCYRNQQEVLWVESARNAHWRAFGENLRLPSGHNVKQKRCASVALERGGVTPFNLIPLPNSDNTSHGAGTPLKLCDWWTRYLCPPGGVVADWFAGTATTGIAALQNGCDYIGVEKFDAYVPIAEERLEKASQDMDTEFKPISGNGKVFSDLPLFEAST